MWLSILMYYLIKYSTKIKKLCDSICMVSLGVVCLSLNFFQCFIKMDKNKGMFDNIMSEEVDMNEENQDEPGVTEENGEELGVYEHVDCFDAFNTS